MNRGSVDIESPEVCISTGFNEAPIHESGKSEWIRQETLKRNASMRPRFMNRGSEMVCDSRALYGPGFNEAPIHESGKSSSATTTQGTTMTKLQ